MDSLEFFNIGQSAGQNDDVCMLKLKLHSPGIMADGLDNFLGYTLPRLQLQLALMFLLTQFLHLLLRGFNLPRIVSEILAGIILGKSVLGKILKDDHKSLFPEEDVLLDVLSKFGIIFFMFLVGVKMDPGMIWKAGRKVWSIAVVMSFVPAIMADLAGTQLDAMLPIYRRPATRSVVGILILTPFPVIAGLLIDLKIMNTELGRLSLASTLIIHILNTIMVLINVAVRISTAGLGKAMVTFGAIVSFLFIVGVVLVSRPLFLLIIKRTPEGKPVKRIYIAAICWAVLLVALICDNVGLQYDFAPFVLGLTVPDGPPLGSTLTDRLDTFISGLLAPLMMTYCAIKIDLSVVYDYNFLRLIWLVILVTVGVKFLLAFGTAWLNRVPIRDAATLGIILDAQGIVQGALYDNQFKNQTLDDETFTSLIMSILVMAILTHLLVSVLYDYSRTYTGYQKRNIFNTTSDAELRVLVCNHRQDDALASLKLLETSNPSKESPLAAYVLNLVELVGRATPLLINHRLGQKNTSGSSRSQQIIDLFQNFESQYSGSVSVQVFTSISLPRFMHHDICSVAFDKLTSVIILPFHKKWSQQGKVIFDSTLLRTMNQEVLDMSPCSVAILIDRRKIHNETSEGQSIYKVAVIFLGGDDDREALAYAKRMASSMWVHLTVFRLLASNNSSEAQWDTVLDIETLRDIKILGTHQNNIVYKEEKVNDGSETLSMINAMEEVFDLIMVGRRHRQDLPMLSGLSEWSELPELGPLGDILASSDVKKPVSVLVVQQQIVKMK